MYFNRKESREQVLEENRESRKGRTDEDQLALLDIRLGKDQGARRERARLAAKIEKKNNEKLSNKVKKRKKRNKDSEN
tara:strand:+ start:393 stop:626 length:234 start_codon:yes stop_codon:yes gene_type:complete